MTFNRIKPFCRCCGQEGNHVRCVAVEAVHPATDRAQVDSLELCGPCERNPAAAWRLRWQPQTYGLHPNTNSSVDDNCALI